MTTLNNIPTDQEVNELLSQFCERQLDFMESPEGLSCLLVALATKRPTYRVRILTLPPVVDVDGVAAFSWDPNAIYAPNNPARALALSAYEAITKRNTNNGD